MMTWRGLRNEPFRLLFPLGAVFGCLGAGHWLWYALGWRSSYSGFYHASVQMGAYLLCFVVGFLLTALPRFAAAPIASTQELIVILALLTTQIAALWGSQWILAEACFAGLLVTLAIFAGRRFAGRRSTAGPPTEFVWIPAAILFGCVGAVLLLLGQAGLVSSAWLALGRPLIQQGFLLAIVLGVGGFMIPRLMGRPVLLVTPPGASQEDTRRVRRHRIRVHTAAALILAVSFGLEGWGAVRPAYLLRAATVTAVFWWVGRIHRPPEVPDCYVRWLWRSVWLVIGGYWAAGAWPAYRVAMLHLVFLGGFSLMAFMVGTMVVLSHTGAGRKVREPLWIFHLVGWGISAAVAARLAADLLPAHYFQLLGAAASCWLLVGLSWVAFILPRVLRSPVAGVFEAAHEQAKQRLRR